MCLDLVVFNRLCVWILLFSTVCVFGSCSFQPFVCLDLVVFNRLCVWILLFSTVCVFGSCSFQLFVCLDLVLECYQTSLFHIFGFILSLKGMPGCFMSLIPPILNLSAAIGLHLCRRACSLPLFALSLFLSPALSTFSCSLSIMSFDLFPRFFSWPFYSFLKLERS